MEGDKIGRTTPGQNFIACGCLVEFRLLFKTPELFATEGFWANKWHEKVLEDKFSEGSDWEVKKQQHHQNMLIVLVDYMWQVMGEFKGNLWGFKAGWQENENRNVRFKKSDKHIT